MGLAFKFLLQLLDLEPQRVVFNLEIEALLKAALVLFPEDFVVLL